MRVYVIAQVDVESFWIRNVCGSEHTARKRFEELRKTLLKGAKGLFDRPNDDWSGYKEILETTTFENQKDSIHDHPVAILYKVED